MTPHDIALQYRCVTLRYTTLQCYIVTCCFILQCQISDFEQSALHVRSEMHAARTV